MRKGIVVSGALHLGVIGATLVAWPHALNLPDEETPVVPVELVTIADTSNIAPTVTQPEPEPVAEPTPPPEPVVKEEPPPPEEVAPSEKPPPEEKVAEEAEPEAKPPRNPIIPRPRPPAEKPQKFDLDNVLALLDKRAPKAPPAPPNARVAEQAIRGIGAQNAMTLDIRDALLAQMRECWNVPAGAPEPEKLIVQVRVFLARDGDLAQPPQLMPDSRAAAASNAYIRTAAEAALRAVNVCAPYHDLPTDRYDVWREIVMTFDPSKMVGR